MTPDKIYVTTYSVNPAYSNKWGCWTERECAGDVYIRKDALLEKINEFKRSSLPGKTIVVYLKEYLESL